MCDATSMTCFSHYSPAQALDVDATCAAHGRIRCPIVNKKKTERKKKSQKINGGDGVKSHRTQNTQSTQSKTSKQSVVRASLSPPAENKHCPSFRLLGNRRGRLWWPFSFSRYPPSSISFFSSWSSCVLPLLCLVALVRTAAAVCFGSDPPPLFQALLTAGIFNFFWLHASSRSSAFFFFFSYHHQMTSLSWREAACSGGVFGPVMPVGSPSVGSKCASVSVLKGGGCSDKFSLVSASHDD